jgi:hypothetical protein
MQAKHRFEQLKAQADRLVAVNLTSMLQADPARAIDFSIRVGPLYANFARQGYDREALAALDALAESASLGAAFRRLFDGEIVNVTEGRAALHTALRGNLSQAVAAREAFATASEVRQRMGGLVADLENSDITDIVSVGIGGSDLGPRLVVDSLRAPGPTELRVHFARSGHHRWHPDFQDFRHAGNPAQRHDPSRLARWQRTPVRRQCQSRARRSRIRHRRRARVADVGLGRRAVFAVVGRGFPDCAGDRFRSLRSLAGRCG